MPGKRSHVFVLLALVLAGCASGEKILMDTQEPQVAVQVPREACEQPSSEQCKFINSPVKLDSRPIRLSYNPYPFYHTRNDLKFVDAKGATWVAPTGILTDGASIPPMFVPFIGDPMSKEFLNAATVHDSYSAESNKGTPYYHAAPWQDVHRMLYDALRVSGTPAVKAKIMYAAVYLGGPRWKEVRSPAGRRQAQQAMQEQPVRQAMTDEGITITAAAGSVRDVQSDTPLSRLFSRAQLIDAFKRARAYIMATNPHIADLEIYLTRLELGMASNSKLPVGKKRNFGTRIYLPGEARETGGEGSDGNSAGESGGASAGGNNAGGGDAGAG